MMMIIYIPLAVGEVISSSSNDDLIVPNLGDNSNAAHAGDVDQEVTQPARNNNHNQATTNQAPNNHPPAAAVCI